MGICEISAAHYSHFHMTGYGKTLLSDRVVRSVQVCSLALAQIQHNYGDAIGPCPLRGIPLIFARSGSTFMVSGA